MQPLKAAQKRYSQRHHYSSEPTDTTPLAFTGIKPHCGLIMCLGPSGWITPVL